MTIWAVGWINLKTVEELEFYHIPLGAYTQRPAGLEMPSDLIKFETCQRLLFFKEKPSDRLATNLLAEVDGLELYRGEKAIEFLLEVLCGLKSRVLGETEIFGQFKHFIEETTDKRMIQWNPELIRFLFETVKEMRLQYISKWGVQSYGSMIRKFLKTESSVVLVGYGQLGQKLLPWLKGKNLTILVRNPGKLSKAEIEKDFGATVTIASISEIGSSVFADSRTDFGSDSLGAPLATSAALPEATAVAPPLANPVGVAIAESISPRLQKPVASRPAGSRASVVIAAPLSNQEIFSCFTGLENSVSSWIDCRSLDGEVRRSLLEDPKGKLCEGTLIELEQIFARIEKDQEKARREKKALLDILNQKSRNFCLRSSHRPLGWDDLCA